VQVFLNLLFIYVVEIQLSRGEEFDPINRFNFNTCFVICHMSFLYHMTIYDYTDFCMY